MEPSPTHVNYGVGARVALHPMSDRCIDIILGALADAACASQGVTASTGSVSTYLSGDERSLLHYLTALIAAAARRAEGEHLAATVLLSRGCPGEVTCELRGAQWASEAPLEVDTVGVQAVAEWSLYPLLDGGDAAQSAHMEPIMAAVEQARSTCLFDGSEHYVTRLRGDIADILALAVRTWRDVGTHVQHVVTHLSFSINSPTQEVAS